jgi:hypothetical protein
MADGRALSRTRGHATGEVHLRVAARTRGQQTLAQFGLRPVNVHEPRQPCLGVHERVVAYGANARLHPTSSMSSNSIIARALSNDDFVMELKTTSTYQRDGIGPSHVVRGCVRHRACR